MQIEFLLNKFSELEIRNTVNSENVSNLFYAFCLNGAYNSARLQKQPQGS